MTQPPTRPGGEICPLCAIPHGEGFDHPPDDGWRCSACGWYILPHLRAVDLCVACYAPSGTLKADFAEFHAKERHEKQRS